MKPEKEFKIGAVAASIWPREVNGNNGTFTTYSVKIERAYQDKAGQWQHTNSFQVSDLPKVEMLAREAFKYVSMRSREPGQDNPDNS